MPHTSRRTPPPPPAKITVPEGENKKLKRNFFIFDPKRGDEVGKARDIRLFCDNPLIMIRVTHLIVPPADSIIKS